MAFVNAHILSLVIFLPLVGAAAVLALPARWTTAIRLASLSFAMASLGLAGCFAVLVTADDVETSKPDPASYRLGVARLADTFPDAGIAAESCVAIEDTADGIASARGAGLAVLGVATHLTADELLAAGASAAVETLEGLGPGFLAGLLP